MATIDGYDFFRFDPTFFFLFTLQSIVSTSLNSKDNTTTVYLAGWANDGTNDKFGFVVARGIAPVNGAFNSIKVSQEDISEPLVDVCIDAANLDKASSVAMTSSRQ